MRLAADQDTFLCRQLVAQNRKLELLMATKCVNMLTCYRGIVTEYSRLIIDSFRLLGDTSNYTDVPKLPATNFRGRTSLETLFRPGAEEIPLFFTYTPACKKVPVTKEMATDIRAVWRTVKRLAWSDYGDVTGCDKDNDLYY